MIRTWYVEAGKYDVLPVDSRGQLRAADPRPTDRCRSYQLHLLPRHADGAGKQRAQRDEPAVQHHGGCRDSQGWRRGSAALRWRCPGRPFLLRAGRKDSTTSTPTWAANSSTSNQLPVPAGRHKLRLSSRSPANSTTARQGAPGRGHLYIDDKPVGEGDIPLTMPVLIGLAGGIVCGADTGSPVWDNKPPFKFTGTLYSTTWTSAAT